VLKRYAPSELNSSICSPATADTVTRALRAVVNEGTATRLRNAKLPVAGKTGTARVVLSPEERGGSKDPYSDAYGRKKFQGTFVGFFPADDPKYTILVTVYSYPSHRNFYGGTKPAMAVRSIVDQLYALDPAWRPELTPTATVPQMKKEK
jgi:cell division protein FtsI (penicillin-binding protein 3)